MGSDDNEDPDDFKKLALARGAGVQRAVWDLRYEGAHKVKGGRMLAVPANRPRRYRRAGQLEEIASIHSGAHSTRGCQGRTANDERRMPKAEWRKLSAES
jgi:hypothetical protein